MASLRRRLLKPGQACRIFNSPLRILTSASSQAATGGVKGREGLQHRLNHRINERQMCTITSSGKHVKPVSNFPESFSMLPAVLAGAFGIGMLQLSHADAKEQADPQAAPISESPPLGYDNGDKIVRHEKDRMEGLPRIRSKGMPNGSYPPFTIAIKDQKVTPFPVEKSVAYLEGMGVKVFGLGEPHAISSNAEISWENIAGYNPQKREIEDSILLALHSPEVYDDIARVARHKFVSNRPRAVLFEGPPGTGKTSCARAIANQAVVPLIYVPLEVVMSMYYGESVRLLEKVFSLANELPDGAIIFLDEVDSFVIARDDRMHEATRRILSVLLRQIDGFEQEKRVVVIAATNRTKDLDPALISRFDLRITFGLPDRKNREDIAAHYAKHLNKADLVRFSCVTEGLSGRDIRDVCQQAERHWASKIIRGEAPSDAEQRCFPPIQEYMESASIRQKAYSTFQSRRNEKPNIPKSRLNKRDPFVSV